MGRVSSSGNHYFCRNLFPLVIGTNGVPWRKVTLFSLGEVIISFGSEGLFFVCASRFSLVKETSR